MAVDCGFRIIMIVAGLLLAGAWSALSAQGPDELEKNRQSLEKVKQDPEQFSKLRQNLKAFQNLPPQQQERLRKLDRELHEMSSASSYRLFRSLERYADWLDRLPEADRRRVET